MTGDFHLQTLHRNPIQSVFTFLGIVLSILSLSSLLQHWGEMTLAEYTERILGFYRKYADQLQWLMFDWWIERFWPDVVFPDWGIDTLVLSVFLYVASFRAQTTYTNSTVSMLNITPLFSDDNDVKFVLIGLWNRFGWKLFVPPILLIAVLIPIVNNLLTLREKKSTYRKLGLSGSDLQEWRNLMVPSYLAILFAISPIIGSGLFFIFNGLML